MGLCVSAQLAKVRRCRVDESLKPPDLLSEHLDFLGETGPLAGEGETGFVLAEELVVDPLAG